MRFTKHKAYLWLVAGLLWLASSPAQAAIIVRTDSGTIGTFDLTNLGGGVLQLDLNGSERLQNINGIEVGPYLANFDDRVMLNFSSTGANQYSISTGTLSKVFTDAVGGTAMINFTITMAETGSLLTDSAFMGGPILGLVFDNFADYTFSALPGVNNFAFTSTFYTGGASSMEGVFQTPGARATGSVAFSESFFGPDPAPPVPEPGTMIMAATGLLGLGLRRMFQRRKTVAA